MKKLRNIYADFDPSFLVGFTPGPKRLLVKAILHSDFNKGDKKSIIIIDNEDATKRDYALYYQIIYKGDNCDRFDVNDLVLAVPASQDWLDKKIALIHVDDVVGHWGEGVWEEAEPVEPDAPDSLPIEVPAVSDNMKEILGIK